MGGAAETATISGGVTNSGSITATGGKSGIGILVNGNTPISGGITNTGTIIGSTAAISLAGETGVANTVTQAGGAIVGNIIGSGNANGDVLNLTGGQIVLAPTQSISGFGTYNQTGGTLVFNVTQSAAPGTYPTLSAGTINLRGGTFELVAGGRQPLRARGTRHDRLQERHRGRSAALRQLRERHVADHALQREPLARRDDARTRSTRRSP